MDNMVKRVAKAIAEERGGEWPPLSGRQEIAYCSEAQAAIEATGVVELREALEKIIFAPMIDHKHPERGVYGIARQALTQLAKGSE